MTQISGRQGRQRVTFILFVVTLVAYGQVASFDFTNYDDHFFVTENPHVLQGITLANVLWAFADVSQGSWQPLTWLSHMTDSQVFALVPAGHHLVSALIHAVNSALLCSVLTRYTGALWPSALVAALFALHPLHVESVAWISERRDVLSGLWWLLGMWSYWRWCHDRGRFNAALVALCFLAGLMSKPMVVTLPLVFLLLDVWPLRRLPVGSLRDFWQQRRQLLKLVGEKTPFFAMALISGGLTIFAEGGQGTLGTLAEYPLPLRAGNALLSYLRYLGKTLWPASLLPFYPYPEVLAWHAALSLVVLILITLFCLNFFSKHPYLLIGWLWYLVTLLPVIGIIQQGEFSMADRYTYLPLTGIFVMLAWGGAALVESWPLPRRGVFAIVGLLLVALTALTVRQTAYWRDTPTLFTHTLTHDPENFKALLQLGAYHRDRGDLERAKDFFVQVVRQQPRNLEALANLGDVYDKMGRYGEAEGYFQQALTINPDEMQVHVNLGVLLAKQGQLQAAVAHFEKALSLQPDDVRIRMNLGGALYLLGQFNVAAEQFSLVLGVEPSSADAYNGLGLVRMGEGRVPEAVDLFQKAVRLNPSLQSAQDNLQSASAKVREAR